MEEIQKDDFHLKETNHELRFEEPTNSLELKSLSNDVTTSVGKEEIAKNDQTSQVYTDLQKLFPTETGRMMTLRQKIFQFLEEPSGGKWVSSHQSKSLVYMKMDSVSKEKKNET